MSDATIATTTCGTCRFTWDDSIVTDVTPAPSARTPCEPCHLFNADGDYMGVDQDAISDELLHAIHGEWPGDDLIDVDTADQHLAEAHAFFLEHAGFNYGPDETPEEGRARCALELAMAEHEAKRRGWRVATSDDPYVMEDDAGSVELVASGEMVNLNVWLTAGPDADPECLSDVIGVLGGVVVPSEDAPYVRVVGAELAMEALAEGPDEEGRRSQGDVRLLSDANVTERPALPKRVERVRLWGWSDTIEPPVLSLLFGELVKRAVPVVEHYHSDLYHDAHWLAEHVTGPATFEFIVKKRGTYIGEDLSVVIGGPRPPWGALNRGDHQPWIRYRVELTCDEGEWSVTFTELERNEP